MNILQRIDYKLGKTLQAFGLSYAPSVEAVQAWLQKFERPACHYHYSGDHVLLSAAPIEERLANQYCALAQQYAPNQEYVVFDPAYLAQDGPWTRAYVERCLPAAQCINIRHISVAFLENVIHRPHSVDSKKWLISLPNEVVHELSLLYTEFYDQAGFAPTDFCNLKCKMCFYHTEDISTDIVSFGINRRRNIIKHQLSDDLAYAFIDQIAPGKEIVFGGCGEFFTHKSWRGYFSYASGKGLVPCVLTNGLLLTKENADFCMDHGLKGAIFSIDGYDKSSYESIRIGGTFERVMNNLEYMFKQGKVYIRVNSVMLPEMQDKKTEIKKLFADKAHALSYYTVKTDQYSNTEKPLRKYDDSGLCYALLGGIILMPDGRYAPCCGVLNATFCSEFPWLLDSREISYADARRIYAEMLFDKDSPLSLFCNKCNLKWSSYYYNGEHALEACISLNPFTPL